MSEGGALDILPQIQALVCDKLQVVSYKWLSRNFSVSSNRAKRLLQEFVDKYGHDLGVIYQLSGWLKSNPQTYYVKLVSGLKLAEVKQEFKDNCSVQVYSVQACIPEDLALLWNAEFVQAEEFFNQPVTEENCLRDNRFCSISTSFIRRTLDGELGAAPAQPINAMGVPVKSKFNSIVKEQPVEPQKGQVGKLSTKNGMQSTIVTSEKVDKIPIEGIDKGNKPSVVKESGIAVRTNKTKGQSEKALCGSTGSLANLWGRASAKSKYTGVAIETTNDVPDTAVTADAQICAREAADAASSDDDVHIINCKRESNGANSRKRRVVIDFSDDDEENVVSLASPDLPNGQKNNLDIEEQKRDILGDIQENVKGITSRSSSEADIRSESKNMIAGISLQQKTHDHAPERIADKNQSTSTATTSPKRKKVLKTRIDERGREVTEVVWEGKAASSDNADKNIMTSDAGNRPPVANKAQVGGSSGPAIPVSKGGNKKSAKGGGKDTKQGNLLAFFKKI
ncbi:uncharacterized protein LOC103707345 isoform X2 [Phoenix dactylifera]|uniref:DNA polymerase delta subunit 3 n=1 Tax=Phoenix dactylifera TaxID=42345 RepID=A0A8B9AFG8_PHODC|nr:uncharacterized protein LOC103707345 isoform X2 [Phoenix dactylifera]